MKNRKCITVIASLLLTLTLSSISVQAEEAPSENQSKEATVITEVSQQDYRSNVSDLSIITTQTFRNSLVQDIKNDEYIYIGRETCYHCRQFSPTIKEFNLMINHQLKYYDIDSDSFNENDAQFIFNEIGIPGTPTILHIVNGKIVAGWIGGGITANQLKEFFDTNVTLE